MGHDARGGGIRALSGMVSRTSAAARFLRVSDFADEIQFGGLLGSFRLQDQRAARDSSRHRHEVFSFIQPEVVDFDRHRQIRNRVFAFEGRL